MTETPAGVIHDIGYQPYDGERLGRWPSARTLYVSALRSTFGLGFTAKSKIMPFLLAGCMLLPALVLEIVLVAGRSLGPGVTFDEQVVAYTDYLPMAQAVVAIFVAAQAPVVFSRDLRFRTVALYFARPLTRFDYVTAKFLALVSGIAILCLAPLLLMFIGGLLAELPFDQELVGFAQALVGVGILSLLLAGIGGLLASATTRRGVGVAIIITFIMVSMALATVIDRYATIQQNDAVGGLAALLSPFTLLDAIQGVLFGSSGNLADPPSGLGWSVLYPTAGLVFAAGLFGLLLARYRKVTGA